jgi:hypothetical protein
MHEYRCETPDAGMTRRTLGDAYSFLALLEDGRPNHMHRTPAFSRTAPSIRSARSLVFVHKEQLLQCSSRSSIL